jgi:predicted RNase H-like HicB family nuclease
VGDRRQELAMTQKIVIHESEEGFGASCPDLPGCWSQGATAIEALENIGGAIRASLSSRRELDGFGDTNRGVIS